MESLYSEGAPNPEMAGRSVHPRVGEGISAEEIERVAAALALPVSEIDRDGYQCEIIGGAQDQARGRILYVQSRAKEIAENHVDVAFKIHLRNADNSDTAWDIESYNPYFGCDIRYLKWLDDFAIVIYREKHSTYVCRIQPGADAQFEKIADYWPINGNALGYWRWRDEVVQCLLLLDFKKGEPLSQVEAKARGLLPPMPWIEFDRQNPNRKVQPAPSPPPASPPPGALFKRMLRALLLR